MATLMDAHLPSDDEEDEDFDPDKAQTGGGGSKAGKGAKRGFMEVSDGEDDDDEGKDEAVVAGVRDGIADGLADAMDGARYCVAAGPEEPAARPALRHGCDRARHSPHVTVRGLEHRAHADVQTLPDASMQTSDHWGGHVCIRLEWWSKVPGRVVEAPAAR